MRKLCSRAMRRMRSLVSARTSGLSFSALETVAFETFARRAISAMVWTDFLLIDLPISCNRLHFRGFLLFCQARKSHWSKIGNIESMVYGGGYELFPVSGNRRAVQPGLCGERAAGLPLAGT